MPPTFVKRKKPSLVMFFTIKTDFVHVRGKHNFWSASFAC
jgi:hypothetical protein